MVNELETESLRNSGLADRERVLEVGVRTRNDVHGHELTHATSRGSACIGGRLHGSDITAHDRGHITGADLLPADERHFGGFDHRVGRFDHRDQSLGLHHSQRLTHAASLSTQSLRFLTASVMSAVSSPYVSRISPSLLARCNAEETSGT